MSRIAILFAAAFSAAALAACAGPVAPYEGLSKQQLRGLPREMPEPPAPEPPEAADQTQPQ